LKTNFLGTCSCGVTVFASGKNTFCLWHACLKNEFLFCLFCVQDDDSDDDDTAELLAELQKIKKERAAEKAKMVRTCSFLE
jgi:hypothetical protein